MVDGATSWCEAMTAGVSSGVALLGESAYTMDHGCGVHPFVDTHWLEGERL